MMENNRNEMMYITMYADDTGLFSERECDFDNNIRHCTKQFCHLF